MQVFKNLQIALLEAQELFLEQGWEDVEFAIVPDRRKQPKYIKQLEFTLRYKDVIEHFTCKLCNSDKIEWALTDTSMTLDLQTVLNTMSERLNLLRIDDHVTFHKADGFVSFRELSMAGSPVSTIALAKANFRLAIYTPKDAFGSLVASPTDNLIAPALPLFLLETKDQHFHGGSLGKRMFLGKREPFSFRVAEWANVR